MVMLRSLPAICSGDKRLRSMWATSSKRSLPGTFCSIGGSTVTAADRLVIDNRTWEIYEVNNSEMYQTAVRCEVYAFGEERRA